MAITVFNTSFGPMDERSTPAPFLLNAGTYKVWMQPVDIQPTGKEMAEIVWDDSAVPGTSGARGNRWEILVRMTAGSGIQSFTIPTGGLTVKFLVRGNVLVTITS